MSLTSLQRCSRRILQPQPTGPPGHSLGEFYPSADMQSVYSTGPSRLGHKTLVGGVLPLCRDSVGVFCSPSRLGHQDTRWGNLTPLQICSRYIQQAQADWATRHSLGEFYLSVEIQSVYSAALADWVTRKLVGGILPLCWDTVGIFSWPKPTGPQDTRWGSLTSL